jgi:hypothetical protein
MFYGSNVCSKHHQLISRIDNKGAQPFVCELRPLSKWLAPSSLRDRVVDVLLKAL